MAFDADSVREQKVQVFRSIRPMSVEDVKRLRFEGSMVAARVMARRCQAIAKSRGVKPKSTTETFASVEFHIDNWRWAGVPFYIRTGKTTGE